MEHKSKGESLEKCQAELKKLRRKSQGSKNPSKYGEKELQVSPSVVHCWGGTILDCYSQRAITHSRFQMTINIGYCIRWAQIKSREGANYTELGVPSGVIYRTTMLVLFAWQPLEPGGVGGGDV